jgi:hypothetical protein
MDHPEFRHHRNGLTISDPVEVLVGDAWVHAVCCFREDGTWYWATADLAKLGPVTEWRHAQEDVQGPKEDRPSARRVQVGQAAQRQARTRKGASR